LHFSSQREEKAMINGLFRTQTLYDLINEKAEKRALKRAKEILRR
jgi:hypothetical protein